MGYSEPAVTLQFQARLRSISFFLATIACLTGVLVLIGWAFDLEVIKRIFPHMVAMNPVTAICFVLSGSVLILIHRQEENKFYQLIWRILSLLICLAAATCLVMNVFNLKGGIDQWLFTEKLYDQVSEYQNRMAPNTAFNFILVGLSYLIFNPAQKTHHKLCQFLVLVPALVSLLSIIGYVYGVRSFYGVLTYIPMAINTSFCFLLLSSSLLLASNGSGFMSDFTSNYVGSVLARKLIPAIILVPILLGVIILYGEQAGLYVPHFGAALFTAIHILIFMVLIKHIQTRINISDAARTTAEAKLIDLNIRLEDSATNLQNLNTELESYSYSISHDLKAPLRSIEGYSRILQEDFSESLGEDGVRQLGIIIGSVRKMNQLIDDLLEFSRIRKNDLQTTHCNMEILVKNVLKEQYQDTTKKEIEIKINELPACSGDPRMIKLVWTNLISNALKYSGKKERPVIEIGSYREPEHTVYYVKDNGDGFDMKYSNKLFSVFQRLHSENEFEGTGIGLAIAHKIVTRHGGKIWFDAEKNVGANFYFSMPLLK